jgi:hypothetical protein
MQFFKVTCQEVVLEIGYVGRLLDGNLQGLFPSCACRRLLGASGRVNHRASKEKTDGNKSPFFRKKSVHKNLRGIFSWKPAINRLAGLNYFNKQF